MPGLQTIRAEEGPRHLQNTKEVPIPVKLQFSGNIPTWLQGTLVSCGPGILDLEKGSVTAWTDGYAIMSKFEIDGNALTFSSKYLQSTAYKKAVKAQKPVVPELLTPPGVDSSRGFFSRLIPAFTPYDVTDNCTVQLVKFGSTVCATGDSPYLHTIDLMNLDTLDTFHCHKAFGMNAFSPGPIKDSNGDTYLMGAAIQPTFRYSVLKMPAENENKKLEKKFETVCTFPSRWKFGATGLRSSFAVTENYVVFVEVPAVVNIVKLTSTYIKNYCGIDWVDWRPEDKTRFCLINKHTAKVVNTEIYADSGFLNSEIVNAYEEGDQIIVDIFTLDYTIFQNAKLNLLRTSQVQEDYKPGEYRRYILPIISDIKSCPEGKSLLSPLIKNNHVSAEAKRSGNRIIVSPELIREKDSGFDSGVINPNFRGIRHSFIYAKSNPASSLVPCSLGNGIAKVDINRRQLLSWNLNPGQFAGQPVFVADPNSTEEDTGVLLILVKHTISHEDNDFLAVVDPKTMTEIGRAEFNCPVCLANGFEFFKA